MRGDAPVAATENVTVSPISTVFDAGWIVAVGAVSTVTKAGSLTTFVAGPDTVTV